MDFWIPLSVLLHCKFSDWSGIHYQQGKHLENCNLLEKQVRHETKWSTNVQLILRCGVVHTQIWRTFSQDAAQLAAKISHQHWKSAARLGRAHLRKVRTVAWDIRDLKAHEISFKSCPPPFPGGLSPKCHHPVPGQVTDWLRGHAGPTAGADPNLPQPRAVFQPQCHLVLCCHFWEWCFLPSPPARAASPQLMWMKPEKQANIC